MHSLRTNCVQLVSLAMNKQWVQLPQVIQILWKNYMGAMILSPLSHLFLSFAHAFPTVLSASKISEITDKQPYFSTLSTPPITTTTIYI